MEVAASGEEEEIEAVCGAVQGDGVDTEPPVPEMDDEAGNSAGSVPEIEEAGEQREDAEAGGEEIMEKTTEYAGEISMKTEEMEEVMEVDPLELDGVEGEEEQSILSETVSAVAQIEAGEGTTELETAIAQIETDHILARYDKVLANTSQEKDVHENKDDVKEETFADELVRLSNKHEENKKRKRNKIKEIKERKKQKLPPRLEIEENVEILSKQKSEAHDDEEGLQDLSMVPKERANDNENTQSEALKSLIGALLTSRTPDQDIIKKIVSKTRARKANSTNHKKALGHQIEKDHGETNYETKTKKVELNKPTTRGVKVREQINKENLVKKAEKFVEKVAAKVQKATEPRKAVYCYCRSSARSSELIGCDYCTEWFHPACLGMGAAEARLATSISTWMCPECMKRQGGEEAGEEGCEGAAGCGRAGCSSCPALGAELRRRGEVLDRLASRVRALEGRARGRELAVEGRARGQ
jgi:hypothetical protein